MPNVRQLIALNEQFNANDNRSYLLKDFLNHELIKGVAFEKGFNSPENFVLEHLAIGKNTPSLIKYFETRPTEDVVLLYFDITGFSHIIEDWTNERISRYLDNYYKIVFPIVFKYGGQIEKLMGDGVICVFGRPFINVDWVEEFNRAELCAKEIIQRLENTNKAVKVALHCGQITYYKTPGTDYEEYTMIGRPLTELYRLESVSKPNAINYYGESIYDGISPYKLLGLSRITSKEVTIRKFKVDLRGVAYDIDKYLKFK